MPAVWTLASLALPCLATIDVEFHAWARQHGKKYSSDKAYQHAMTNFFDTAAAIDAMNADPNDQAVYAHNQFSDLSNEEFRQKYMGIPASGRHEQCLGGSTLPIPSDTPTSHDWREHGAVTAVRDQGGCGSCWAESAVANLEGVHFLASGNLVPLSVEQVLECDQYDTACYGGWPAGAFKHVIEAGGLASDSDYQERWNGKTICLANQEFNETCGDGMCDDPPLTSWCDVTCEASTHTKTAKIDGWASLPEDEDAIAALLARHGPISVAIDASGGGLGILFPWLKSYKSGIATPSKCSTDALDHGVTIVGFGEENGQKYWTIKNSWGPKFGESGYFRLARGTRQCGIDTCASTATISSALLV